MTFRDFKAQVNALPAHDLANVPCDGVELNGCDVALPGSEDHERIAELESDFAYAEKEVEEANESITKLEEERDKLEEQLESLKDTIADIREPESGVTLKDMLARTEEAERKERAANERTNRWIAQPTAANSPPCASEKASSSTCIPTRTRCSILSTP